MSEREYNYDLIEALKETISTKERLIRETDSPVIHMDGYSIDLYDDVRHLKYRLKEAEKGKVVHIPSTYEGSTSQDPEYYHFSDLEPQVLIEMLSEAELFPSWIINILQWWRAKKESSQ